MSSTTNPRRLRCARTGASVKSCLMPTMMPMAIPTRSIAVPVRRVVWKSLDVLQRAAWSAARVHALAIQTTLGPGWRDIDFGRKRPCLTIASSHTTRVQQQSARLARRIAAGACLMLLGAAASWTRRTCTVCVSCHEPDRPFRRHRSIQPENIR